VIDQSSDELLIEVAELLKKYNPELSESIAKHLSSPEFVKRLVSILSTKSQQHKKKRKPEEKLSAVKRTQRGLRESLLQLEETEPEKSAILVKFYDELKDKSLLPEMQDIRKFSSDKGLPKIKVNSRRDAINPLVKSLLRLSVKEIKAKLNEIMPISIQDDRSLEGWADIILNKHQHTKEDE
jgi:hypothetical protein